MYKILSLSGGGARGIYQAVFLQELEQTLGAPLHKHFDLIAGTSTGSIVAAGVAFDIGLANITRLFRDVAPQIFKPRWFWRVRTGPRYSSTALRKALDTAFVNRTEPDAPTPLKLKDAPTPLLIPATGLDKYTSRQFSTFAEDGVVFKSGEPRVAGPDGSFSTPGRPKVNYIDPDLKVADVVLASCAAPSYFPPVSPAPPRGRDDSRSYMDGGMWANSPSLVAVITAHHYLKIPLADIRVLSIGNGETALGMAPKKFGRLLPLWKTMITSMFDVMFAAQRAGADELAEMLIRKENVKRIDSVLEKPINLDEAKRAIEELPNAASKDAAREAVEIQKFLSPPAAPDEAR